MRNIRLVTLLTLVGAGLLFGPRAASAQTCIQDVWKAHGNSQNLNCTAQDVTLSSATNINIITGGSCDPVTGVCSCFAGQTVTFTADFRMDLTAQARYDVGFYLATDSDPNSDGAITGQCTASASLVSNTPAGNFINLDAAPDVCGDITGPLNTAHNPLFVNAQVSAQCPLTPGQNLTLPFATTWRQGGANQVCAGTGNGTTTNDVFPGSPSKCNAGTLTIPIISITTVIDVTKTALTQSVPETGGSASYSVVVNNTSTIDVTLRSLVDTPYGDITQVQGAITATNCGVGGTGNPGTLPAVILAGGNYTCSFTATVPPGDVPGKFTDVVRACADNVTNPDDVCDTDDADVPYTDVANTPTLTKTAASNVCRIDTTYNVVVSNTNPSGGETVTLSALNDDIYGNIANAHVAGGGFQEVVSTTCGLGGTGNPGTLPAVIAGAGNYSCSFVGRINSCSTTVKDTVTGTAEDEDGVPSSPSDDATVVVSVTTP